jgi:PAS domain S-box-containing protein
VDSGSSKINQDILETFTKGKKSLSISDISRLSGHHRHTVARYLDNLVSSGKLEMRQHGQKKKYYLSDIQPESSILNFSPHMLIILNMDLSIRWANDSFLRMIHSTIEAISNLSIEALHLDDLFGPDLVAAIRMVRPGETRSEEARIIREEKETLYLFTISAVSFFQERPALVITGEDITEKKALQEAIRTSESNLRLITESVHDMIIRWEPDGMISYVSPACELLTGYVSQELMGKTISEFIHPEDLPRFQNGGETETVNWSRLPSSFRFRTLKGKWIWFETTTTPRLSETGEILDYISVWRDITAWLEAETKLALSEEKYRRLFEGAKDAIILMELTENLKHARFREVNNLTCQLTGYTYQEFLTLSLSDIIPEPMEEYFNEVTEKFMQNEQGFFEIDLVRKDGTLVPVEVNAHLFYLQGKPVVLAITRDITERRKNEAAIKEAHQRLEDILEFLPDPVFVLDTEGTVTAWNRAMEELTGTKKEDIIGCGDYACAVAFYHQKRPVLADYILHRDETVLFRYNNPDIDGDRVTVDVQTLHPVTKQRIWLWIKAAPIYNLNGDIIGVIETLRDISERKIMELEIRKQNAIFEAVSRAASDILQSANFEDAALRTIGLIGEATSVSRVCLLEKAPSSSIQLIRSELEWNAKTEIVGRTRSPLSMRLKNDDEGSIIEDVFVQEKTIYSLVKDLKGSDRRILEPEGVKSILLVPIKTKTDIWGAVGFLETNSERIWSRKEISALEIGSSLIGSALMRFEAGENLEKSEKQFRTLAQNIPGIVFRVSLAGSDMEFYNDHLESVTGYTAKELASGQISSLIPLIFPDDKQRVIQAKKESIKTGEPYEIEYRIIDKFGHIRVMSERGRPVADETGLVVSIDGIIQEVGSG